MSRAHPGSKYHAAIPSKVWAVVRRAVLDRDGWRCVLCGKAGRLEVDHVQELHKGGAALALDLDNLRALCRECHLARHKRPQTEAEQQWAALVEEML